MLPTLPELSTWPRGRLRLMLSPTTPPTATLVPWAMPVPTQAMLPTEPMEPTQAMVLAMPPAMLASAPPLLSTSTAWPLLLCPHLPEDMQVLAGMLPTLPELSMWPRGRPRLMLSPTTPPTATLQATLLTPTLATPT